MDVQFVLKIVLSACAVIVGTVVPTVISLFHSIKAKRGAKTEAEIEKANNDLREKALELILVAENTYADVNAILKSNGKSAGAMKKQSVMTSMQQYALDKGYAFDGDYWSNKVEEIVAITKQVNSIAP